MFTILREGEQQAVYAAGAWCWRWGRYGMMDWQRKPFAKMLKWWSSCLLRLSHVSTDGIDVDLTSNGSQPSAVCREVSVQHWIGGLCFNPYFTSYSLSAALSWRPNNKMTVWIFSTTWYRYEENEHVILYSTTVSRKRNKKALMFCSWSFLSLTASLVYWFQVFRQV